MKAVGYVRVSTDKQADHGVSLEAQAAKIRAMAVVHGAELIDIIVDGGESAKSLQRPGMERLLRLVDGKKIQAVIVAKLDRLTRSVKDLCTLLDRFERRFIEECAAFPNGAHDDQVDAMTQALLRWHMALPPQPIYLPEIIEISPV